MTKKQNYTAPEVLSMDFYPKESVLQTISSLTLSAMTMGPSDPAVENASFSDNVAW
jgi:hypothetical protein